VIIIESNSVPWATYVWLDFDITTFAKLLLKKLKWKLKIFG